MLALALSFAAFAQEAPAPTPTASVFEDSLGPVLESLLSAARQMEENNIQITDLVVGVVSDDGLGVTVPISLPADADVILLAVGDDRRIKDLDMGVQGRDGLSGADQLDDNVPRVDIHTTYAGEYQAKVVISEPIEGADRGYFMFLTGFPRDAIIASAQPTIEMTQVVVQFAESLGYHFVQGDMETLVADRMTMIEVPIPQDTFGQCLAFAIASSDRSKKVSMQVKDSGGNTLAVGKKLEVPQISVAQFVNNEDNAKHFLQVGAKMHSGIGEALALGMVACTPM